MEPKHHNTDQSMSQLAKWYYQEFGVRISPRRMVANDSPSARMFNGFMRALNRKNWQVVLFFSGAFLFVLSEFFPIGMAPLVFLLVAPAIYCLVAFMVPDNSKLLPEAVQLLIDLVEEYGEVRDCINAFVPKGEAPSAHAYKVAKSIELSIHRKGKDERERKQREAHQARERDTLKLLEQARWRNNAG